MSYFTAFPQTSYAPYGSQPKTVTDILRHINFNTEIVGDVRSLSKYTVQDGDTPEMVSEKIYGTPDHYWILLLVNSIGDPFYEWPLDTRSLDKYLVEKYGDMVVFLGDNEDGTLPCSAAIARGDTVFRTSDSFDLWGNPSFAAASRGTVVSWDKTLGRLGIRLRAGSALVLADNDLVGIKHSDGSLSFARVKRYIGRPHDGAHHFADADGITADPLADLDGHAIGTTGESGSTVRFWDTHIGLYLGASGDPVGQYAINIYDHETAANEARRSIFVVEPSQVSPIVQEFRRLVGEK